MTTRLVGLGLVLAAFGLGGTAGVTDAGSPRSSRPAGDGGLWQAHTLAGDQLTAGPVLLDHQAVWVEAGHRLLVRSLDAHGRTRTIFSTSATPGAPKGTLWPFYVQSLAAGDGRVAFIEEITACGSAPPRTLACTPASEGPPVDSVTLFVGRPGAIRPVESLLHPFGCRAVEPAMLGFADGGLLDYESSTFPCARGGVSRLVFRTFSGRLVRVLARGLQVGSEFVSAGSWAAVDRQPDHLEIVSVRTGHVVLRLSQQGIGPVALDRSGRFALMTYPGAPAQCEPRGGFSGLSVGRIGRPGLQVLASRASPLEPAMAIAGDRVAYLQPTGRCLTGARVAIAAPGAAPMPVPGLKVGVSMAFDGRMVATAGTVYPKLSDGAQRNALQLARVPG